MIAIDRDHATRDHSVILVRCIDYRDGVEYASGDCMKLRIFFSDPEKVSDLDVYKIFTPEPLTVHHVNRLFRSHSEFVVVDWMAYPNYDKIPTDVEVSETR